MKNCSMCMSDTCDMVGMNSADAETCWGYEPAPPVISELDEIRNTLADLALEIQEMRESYNRLLCAFRKEIEHYGH